VVIQQNSRKLLMMDILMSETCQAHKKWNKNSKWHQVGLLFSNSLTFNRHLSCDNLTVFSCVLWFAPFTLELSLSARLSLWWTNMAPVLRESSLKCYVAFFYFKCLIFIFECGTLLASRLHSEAYFLSQIAEAHFLLKKYSKLCRQNYVL